MVENYSVTVIILAFVLKSKIEEKNNMSKLNSYWKSIIFGKVGVNMELALFYI